MGLYSCPFRLCILVRDRRSCDPKTVRTQETLETPLFESRALAPIAYAIVIHFFNQGCLSTYLLDSDAPFQFLSRHGLGPGSGLEKIKEHCLDLSRQCTGPYIARREIGG